MAHALPMSSDDADAWRLKVEAALQVMVSGLASESRILSPNSTLRVCDVCGQLFDTLNENEVFHHCAEPHPPLSTPRLVAKPKP